MESQQRQVSDQIIRNQQTTLLELLDRLIDRGVVVKGEVVLSVADIDLVYLNLELLLGAVRTVERAARNGGPHDGRPPARRRRAPQESLDEPQSAIQSNSAPTDRSSSKDSSLRNPHGEGNVSARSSTSAKDTQSSHRGKSGINFDHDNVEKGLVALVLTLVDLIRQLMEKQAIRRIEDEQLTEVEIERLGSAFFLLDEKITDLKENFDLTDEDLNLNLGPLGDLL
ncbi:hypothetical protein KDW_06160 [Dictyobacter vulcani]|uniref:Uncharacterized protein n=1 Tax=Dictyobacter vulcani TaxID=2607529 RepID=A0A5J4KCB0_9CHLR|nr:gas vesicle protein GvpJ [Dictyobacter vulcani]GER86454.1 hypothetical protein KDW_06160 [Dictyobacter vulcani]